jgi:hypothetical protein
MPNDCSNYVEIVGPKETLEKIQKVMESNPNIGFGLKNLFPCPDELYKSKAVFSDTYPPVWDTWLKDGALSQKEFDDLITELDEHRLAGQLNLEKYGHKDWYSWCLGNWGTKWGDYDHPTTDSIVYRHDDHHIAFAYYTAWGPFEENFWVKVSSDYPDCLFTAVFEESGMCFVGASVAKNGHCVILSEDLRFDWSEDMYESEFESYNELVQDMQESLSEKALEMLNEQLEQTNLNFI